MAAVPRDVPRTSDQARARLRGVDADRAICALARTQHGVVSRTQLLERGIARHHIELGLRRGGLRRLVRGVYAVGIRRDPLEREAAALLACGPAAVLSHGTAGRIWHLWQSRDGAPIDVVLTRGWRTGRSGIRVRQARTLDPQDITRHHGLPITAPARTIFDGAGDLGARGVERAVARLDREHPAERARLSVLVLANPRRPGTAFLRSLLRAGESAFTRSEAEERLLDLVRRSALPAPRVNARVHGLEVDFLWARERLVVEVDGFAFHGSAAAFEKDRARDSRMVAQGYRVLRFTWRTLTETPEAVVASVAQALAHGRIERR